MLPEAGFVRATLSDGKEFTFRPSFSRIASLGSPHEIVAIFAGLHGPHAEKDAAYVLACLCDQEDPSPLIGYLGETGWVPGAMPGAEMVIIAQHLMRHGIVGKARPGGEEGGGKFSDRFDAVEYISAARVHLGLSSQDAEALSMTEFQSMFEMKFPRSGDSKGRDVPTREEYEARMRQHEEMMRGRQGR